MDYTLQLKEEIIEKISQDKNPDHRFSFLAGVTKNLAVVGLYKKGIELVYEIDDKLQAVVLLEMLKEYAEGDVVFEQRGSKGISGYRIVLKDNVANALLEKMQLSRYGSDFIVEDGIAFMQNLDEENYFCYFRGMIYACGRLRFAEEKNSNYILQLTFSDSEYAQAVANVMLRYNIELRHTSHKTGEVLITRNSSDILDILAMCKATRSHLKLNEILIKREEENDFNRASNFYMANYNKTLQSVEKYVQAIKSLQKADKMHLLDEKLRQVADIRIKYPDDSMRVLADMIGMSKTSFSRALNKILALAEEKNARQ